MYSLGAGWPPGEIGEWLCFFLSCEHSEKTWAWLEGFLILIKVNAENFPEQQVEDLSLARDTGVE